MSRFRDEITRTLLRLSKSGSSRLRPASLLDTALVSDEIEEGRQLGPYRIVKRLGMGGMGHIYLALDTRLNRYAALKFLSPDLISDPEMLERLGTEARAASALNHHNILTIYEIGEWEGRRYIASEYVEGLTLREVIERNLVDVPAALDITTQIASALVAAHTAGVIHRDLKPGNIMVRKDGYVKVIDFGLAKRIRRARRGVPDLSVTRPGTIVGTVQYMSPEQAAGGQVDARSDIWSLGVILYELLTRQLPFDGASETAILESIRERPAPELPPDLKLPPGTADFLRRALAKNPADRFQTAREALAALGSIQRPAVGQTTRPIRLKPERPYVRWLIVAVSTIVLLAILWRFGLRDRLFQPNWFVIDKVRQVTFNGRVTLSALSPDGKYLAYVAGDPEGLQTLYLSQIDTATEQVKIPPRKEAYQGITFSPDNKIYAVSEGSDLLGKLYIVPLIGDAPEKPSLVDIDGPVTFSPKGDRFAFIRRVPYQEKGRQGVEHAILLAQASGSELHKITSSRDATIAPSLTWSPETGKIAALYIDYSTRSSGQPAVHVLDLSGRTEVYRTPDWRIVGRPWWNDRYSLLLTATAHSESSSQLQIQQLDLRRSKARNVTRDLAGYRSLTMSSDGSLLAAVKRESRRSLWVSIPHDLQRGQTSLAELARFPTLAWTSPDRIIIDSLRGGFPNLWQLDVNTLTRTSLTSEAFAEQNAVPVPNSKSVVLASNRSGQFKIWRYDLETNAYTQLTFGPNYDQSPTVSPDGKWIVYTSWRSALCQLWKVSINGGDSHLLWATPAKDAQFSPDGRNLVCIAKTGDIWTTAVFPADRPRLFRAFPNVSPPVIWAPDGASLHSVVTDKHGISNIWSTSLKTGKARSLTTFEDQRILKFAWSPGGDRLACLRESFGSDVTLFSRQR